MKETFKQYIREKKLFTPSEKILLAISGGIDSMVLLHLFADAGYRFGVVHCNFNLRGEDSDGDEQFVGDQVLKLGVPFFTGNFDTKEHASVQGISIEMAARELRYRYFEEVRKSNSFDYIATAHHKDDLLETFFLNLSRKTGIKGLTGIKEKAGKVIRPLLFASRQEIVDYAALHAIGKREDSTNSELIYQRNFIRHKVLPLLSELNPAFRKNLYESILNLRDAEEVYSGYLKQEQLKVMSYEGQTPVINIRNLLNTPFPKILLLEILAEYGFNSSISAQVYSCLDSESGRLFYSGKHRLVKDRQALYITPLPDTDDHYYYIEEGDMELFAPFEITIQQLKAENFRMDRSKDIALIDKEKVEFPLLIRKWKAGDYFQPLGMTGFKKLSDFLIDEKVPLHNKENVWLLCSGQQVVWVMGYRLDNRFRITADTRQILKIALNKTAGF